MMSSARGLGWSGSSQRPVPASTEAGFDCALVDLEGHCGLRESLAGYEAALARTRVRYLCVTPKQIPPASVVIVPGCARLEPHVATMLQSSLEAGSLLLIESGATFAESPEFDLHRQALDSHFGLQVGPPMDLWSGGVGEGSFLPKDSEARRGHTGLTRIPYVDYTWPIETKVRDFSRVIPLCAPASMWAASDSEVIGWVNGRPMAARRTMGKGALVFLGSPLGPALRYGDREAERWLRALLTPREDRYIEAGWTRPKRVKS